MLILAAAALAIAPVRRDVNAIAPIYDLTTSVDSGGNVHATFYLSNPWNNSINNANNFAFFFSNGNTNMNNFGPNGNWSSVTPNAYTPPSGNQISLTFPNSNFNSSNPQGVLWIQYYAAANETTDGLAEISVVATSVGANNNQGHGSRPGSVVPIIDTTPSFPTFPVAAKPNYNQPITFYVDSSFSGWPNGVTPSMWCNTGNNNSYYPGNGWQTMNYDGLSVANGYQNVTATGHPNSNAGFYMVGYQQTYTPNGSNSLWTEFSAVTRPISVSQ